MSVFFVSFFDMYTQRTQRFSKGDRTNAHALVCGGHPVRESDECGLLQIGEAQECPWAAVSDAFGLLERFDISTGSARLLSLKAYLWSSRSVLQDECTILVDSLWTLTVLRMFRCTLISMLWRYYSATLQIRMNAIVFVQKRPNSISNRITLEVLPNLQKKSRAAMLHVSKPEISCTTSVKSRLITIN